jgi:hypothetical protein
MYTQEISYILNYFTAVEEIKIKTEDLNQLSATVLDNLGVKRIITETEEEDEYFDEDDGQIEEAIENRPIDNIDMTEVLKSKVELIELSVYKYNKIKIVGDMENNYFVTEFVVLHADYETCLNLEEIEKMVQRNKDNLVNKRFALTKLAR